MEEDWLGVDRSIGNVGRLDQDRSGYGEYGKVELG